MKGNNREAESPKRRRAHAKRIQTHACTCATKCGMQHEETKQLLQNKLLHAEI